jgi:hypothetical protein
VPTKLINPGNYRKIIFATPRHHKVHLLVESSSPVKVRIVDAPDLEKYRTGKVFNGLKYKARTLLRREIEMPSHFSDQWYLILENDSDTEPVAVHYEVAEILHR